MENLNWNSLNLHSTVVLMGHINFLPHKFEVLIEALKFSLHCRLKSNSSHNIPMYFL